MNQLQSVDNIAIIELLCTETIANVKYLSDSNHKNDTILKITQATLFLVITNLLAIQSKLLDKVEIENNSL